VIHDRIIESVGS